MVKKENKCLSCKKKSQIKTSYENKNYCNLCFTKLIEKRVRKQLRINKNIKPGEEIKLLNDNSKEYRIAKKLLKNIFGEYLKIKEVKRKGKEVFNPTNIDREIKEKLELYLKNKEYKKKDKLLLDNVLEEEIIILCKIFKIKIGKKDKKNKLIEDLEKNYPGIKFSLAKSMNEIFLKNK